MFFIFAGKSPFPTPSNSILMVLHSRTQAAQEGGVFRDSKGCCPLSFSRNIGFASSIEAKLWALRDGLSIAVEKHFF